jgi:hypothetical protein
VPEPIVLFFTNVVAVPFLKLFAEPFFTKVDRLVLLMVGLCMRGCTLREGTLRTTAARPPLAAAAAGNASKNVRATTAAATVDTTLVVLILAAPCFSAPEVLAVAHPPAQPVGATLGAVNRQMNRKGA